MSVAPALQLSPHVFVCHRDGASIPAKHRNETLKPIGPITTDLHTDIEYEVHNLHTHNY